jgi:Undecaprenyl-phosphate galactose phosphotransferase WbaP
MSVIEDRTNPLTAPGRPSPTTLIPPRPPLAGKHWKQVLLTSLPLFAADALVLIAGLVAGHALSWLVCDYPMNHPVTFAIAALTVQTALFMMGGLYPAAGVHPAVELRQLVIIELQLAALSTILLGAILPTIVNPYAPTAGIGFLLAMLMIPIARSLMRGYCREKSWWGYPTVLIGDGATCDRIAELFIRDGRQSLRPLARFQDASEYWEDAKDRLVPWKGPLDDVIPFARQEDAFWLIVALPEHLDQETKESIEYFRRNFPHVIMIDSRHELPCLWNRAVDCGGLAAMKVEERLLMPEQRFAKRLLDLTLVMVGSIVFVPLMLAIGGIVLLSSGWPIFYAGRRIGLDGREFRQWKFRSMIRNADAVLQQYLRDHPEARDEFARDQKLRDDPRVTRFGNLLRKTSLDELPQLWNVLRGEMSLVGPRPITEAEMEKYGTTMLDYAAVRPGITGMWQINGRNDTTYEERVSFDRYYVRNWSPWLDIYILAKTVKVVIKREGAY